MTGDCLLLFADVSPAFRLQAKIVFSPLFSVYIMAAFLLFAFIIHTSVWWQKVCRMLLLCHFFLFTLVAQSSACKEKSYFLGCLNFSGVLLLLFTVHHSSYSVSYLTFCFASLVYGLIMSCWGFFGGKPCPQATAEGFMTSALVAAFTKKKTKTITWPRIQFELGHFFIR